MISDLVSRALGRSVVAVASAAWGFQNQTDIVTLEGGERVVLQRYRRRDDAEYRLRAMAAADVGVPVPRVRARDLEADPPWVIYDMLDGVPIMEIGLEDPRFPALTRAMGRLLAALQRVPAAGLELDDLWADPDRLAKRALGWADGFPAARTVIERVPLLFADRPVVLAHGDFAPMNVLTDGTALTGLLDFESARLADSLFDVAWWHWTVGFGPAAALARAWPELLAGAGIADDPERIHVLQVLRMLELLAGPTLSPGVRDGVARRLQAAL